MRGGQKAYSSRFSPFSSALACVYVCAAEREEHASLFFLNAYACNIIA